MTKKFSQSKIDSLENKIADFKSYLNDCNYKNVCMSDFQKSHLSVVMELLTKTIEDSC